LPVLENKTNQQRKRAPEGSRVWAAFPGLGHCFCRYKHLWAAFVNAVEAMEQS